MKSGIYRIGLGGIWFYIGSTASLTNRQRQHLEDLRASRHGNRKIQAIWAKYQTFEFEILEYCSVSELLAREQALLDIHFGTPGCANLCPTAGSSLGRKHSKATLEAMSKARRGVPKPDGFSERLSSSPRAIAARKILADTYRGVQRSEATCERISKGHKASPRAVAHLTDLNSKPKSKATRARMSQFHRSSPAAKARLERMIEENKGVSFSDARRQAISDGLNAYHARKRAEVA